MNKLNYTIGALVFAVIALGVGLLIHAPVVNVQPTIETMGAVSGPRLDFPSWTVNGVETYFYSSGLNKASTTLCSFKSPNATSTLEFASMSLTTGTTTTIQLEIGKSYYLDATTTSLGTVTLAASQKATIIASTTQTSSGVGNGILADPVTVFSPSSYLNFKYGGAQGTTNVLVGTCKAEFIVN